MKNLLIFILFLSLGFSQSKVSIQDKEIEINENEAVVEVLGMVCSMCAFGIGEGCLLYTSPSPRDVEESRMPSSA